MPKGASAQQATSNYVAPSQVRTAGKRRFNLRGVAEVLADYGMDPAEEIAKVLTARTPATEDEPEGRPILDPELRARINLELLQYTRPKLKAVEVTHKTEMDPEEVAARIAYLQKKASEMDGRDML